MDERIKSAAAHAVMEAGTHLKGANGGRKSIYDLERRCRGIMLDSFRKADPSLSVWGEETQERGVAICALDSAINYGSGFGGYGTMAAYIEGSRPIYAALFLPMDGIMIIAEKGKGARMGGRKISVGAKSDLSRAVICCDCDAYICGDGGDVPLFSGVLDALSANAIPWRNTGSAAQGYAYLAMGMVDGVISPLRESQHAAGYLIMQEAGAIMSDGRGRPFRMESQEVVAASPRIHEELLGIVGGALR